MTIAQYLSEVPKSTESPREIVGQLLDTTAQILELETEYFTGSKPPSNSLGDLQEILDSLQLIELGERLKDIRNYRRTINILSPSLQETNELCELVLRLVSVSKFGQEEKKNRIRYEPELFNSTGIDTNQGFSRFDLYHGSLTGIDCDIAIISAERTEAGLDGQVYNGLKWLYDLNLEQPEFSLSSQYGIINLFNVESNQCKFNHLIIVSTKDENDIYEYKRLIQLAFSFLSFAGQTGVKSKSIGLSLLFGNCLDDKKTLAQILIETSINWLNASTKCHSIRCSIFYTELLVEFDALMNESLNRTFANSGSNSILSALINELKVELSKLLDTELNEGATPLLSALSVKGDINIQLVCTFARTLCELVVKETLASRQRKVSGDLLSSIERLRNDGIASPWICSYMHGIRILGNKSVHPNKSTPSYEPKILGENDLTNALTGIKAILDFHQKSKP